MTEEEIEERKAWAATVLNIVGIEDGIDAIVGRWCIELEGKRREQNQQEATN